MGESVARRLPLLVCFAVVVGLRPPAWGQPEAVARLTMDEAVALAVEHSPAVAAASGARDAKAGELRTAGSLPPLELLVVPAGTFNDSPIIASQRLDLLGKRGRAARVAREEVAVATLEIETVRTHATHEARLAYIALQEAIAEHELAQQSLELREALRRLAEQRFELGDVARVHVDRAEIERDRAREEVTKLSAEVDVRRAALNSLLGRDPGETATLPVVLALGPELTYEIDALRTQALDRRPDVLAARAGIRAGEAGIRLARGARLPDFEVQFRAGDRVGSSGTQIGLGVSLPLIDWGQASGATRAARANADQRRAELAELERVAVLEVVSALRTLQADRQVADAYSTTIATRAQSLAELLQLSYERGGSTLLEVIDAERTLTETQLEHVRATAQYHRSLAELTLAVGGALPQ
ncbi:MAG: TolC family protein [Armatimonadetes bacterium]|nr:TolC family protein [Armatimonadota bacterium]